MFFFSDEQIVPFVVNLVSQRHDIEDKQRPKQQKELSDHLQLDLDLYLHLHLHLYLPIYLHLHFHM